MEAKSILLIVDDEPTNIQVLAACLKDKYRIKVATTGERCLELARAESAPDLILLDIEMPGMDGYEVSKRLKGDACTAAIPIIFVTAQDNEADEERGLLMGAVDYITKPVCPAIVAARVCTHVTLKRQRDKLAEMALHDQLTGLYNRHYLLEVANQKLARAERDQHAMSLLMIDIDHFKAVNDNFGHPMGDAVIQAVAQLLKEQSRKEDVAARFGGEEFVMLLDHCDVAAAEINAEKMRQKSDALKPGGIDVTISIGVVQLRAAREDFSELLKRADLALYQAKNNGRNCVVVG